MYPFEEFKTIPRPYLARKQRANYLVIVLIHSLYLNNTYEN